MSGRPRDTWATCAVPTYKVCRRGVALRPPNIRGPHSCPTPPPTHPRTHTPPWTPHQQATPPSCVRNKTIHTQSHASQGRIQHHRPVHETRDLSSQGSEVRKCWWQVRASASAAAATTTTASRAPASPPRPRLPVVVSCVSVAAGTVFDQSAGRVPSPLRCSLSNPTTFQLFSCVSYWMKVCRRLLSYLLF